MGYLVWFTVCTNSCIDVGRTTTIWVTKSGSVNSQTAPILGAIATGLGQCYRYLTMSLCIRAQRNLSSVVKFVGNTTRSVLTLSDLSEETSPICISRKQSMMGNHRLDLRTWLHEGAIEASGNYRLQMGRKQIIKHTSRKCGLADNYLIWYIDGLFPCWWPYPD